MSSSTPTVYYLLSLPPSAAPPGGDPQTQLNKWLTENLNIPEEDVAQFSIPSFKIGTLDNLVQQSEELAKLDTQFHGIVAKIADIISSIYDGNVAQIVAAKKVDDKNPDKFIKTFSWNTSKYRVDKPIPELVDLISKDTFALDSDVRGSFTTYTAAKSNLTAVDRKQTGNLSVRSLHDVVRREHFVQESEYLTTLLIAVPRSSVKEFLTAYETLTDMVVPRSASVIAEDDEYSLFNVTVFKKFAAEFVAKSREHKWTPREFKYSEALIADLKKEQQVASQAERKQWGDVVRLSRTAYSDVVKGWVHLKAIRVFVESVLRYGLPPNFLSNAIKPSQRSLKKSEDLLVAKFGYLAGNAFEKDKKGKLKSDSDLHEYGALVDADYKPFVIYPLEIV